MKRRLSHPARLRPDVYSVPSSPVRDHRPGFFVAFGRKRQKQYNLAIARARTSPPTSPPTRAPLVPLAASRSPIASQPPPAASQSPISENGEIVVASRAETTNVKARGTEQDHGNEGNNNEDVEEEDSGEQEDASGEVEDDGKVKDGDEVEGANEVEDGGEVEDSQEGASKEGASKEDDGKEGAASEEEREEEDDHQHSDSDETWGIISILDETADKFLVRWEVGGQDWVDKETVEAPELIAAWRKDHPPIWEVEAILREHKTRYLIKWAGKNPKTGKPWQNSWQLKESVNKAAMDEWKGLQKKQARRKKRRSGATK
ncbi:hypothetical protein BST61_g11460 [Cercospora zeina]